jgi:hypothetical protein
MRESHRPRLDAWLTWESDGTGSGASADVDAAASPPRKIRSDEYISVASNHHVFLGF